VKRLDFIRHIEDHGCTFIREGGSHSWWENPAFNRRSAIPWHRKINEKLIRKICRDLAIPSAGKFG